METGSDRSATPQSAQQQQQQQTQMQMQMQMQMQADVATAGEPSQQFLNNLRQVAMHPSPDPIDTVTTGLFVWSARQ